MFIPFTSPQRLIAFAIFFLLFIPGFNAKSQTHTCGFDDFHEQQMKDNPIYFKKVQEYEQFVAFKKTQAVQRAAGDIYTIPVVVHVIHNGEAVGTGSNISDAQIQSAIDNMTDVYRNNTGTSVDSEIEFALATSDPNCNATTGIVRVNGSGVAGYSANGVFRSTIGAVQNDLKDLSKWPTDSYFNIWVVSKIDGSDGSGVQGWAGFINTTDPYNGSVMLYNAFGYDPGQILGYNLKTYTDENETCVHEGGHYLHLYHTFQGDGTGSTCPNDIGIGAGSDGCTDTPVHKRNASTCNLGSTNTCTGGLIDEVVHNFMDYSSCQEEFTLDQKTRMRAALESSGSQILNSRGLQAPISFSAPIAASCTPVTDPAFGMLVNASGVKKVSFSDMEFESGYPAADGGYVDNTSNCQLVANIEQGQSYDLDIEVRVNTTSVHAWIDYNNNGIFEGTEEVVSNNSVPQNTTLSTSVTIPGTSVVNNFLRMRVLVDFVSNPVTGPCYNPKYGQAEDYTVYITSAAVLPDAEFSASKTSICSGQSIDFTDLSTNTPTSWLWTINGGTPNFSADQNPTDVVFSSPGDYTIELTATNTAGSNTETKNLYVSVSSGLNSSISADDTICISGSASLAITATGATDYEWKDGASVVGTNATLNASPSSSTTYLGIVSNSSTGCIDSLYGTMAVVNPNTTVDPDQTICKFAGAIINATGGSKYSWSTGETSAGITVNPLTSTTYNVTASIGTCDGPTVSSIVYLVNNIKASADTTELDLNGDATVVFSPDPDAPGVSYFWDFGDGNTSTQKSPSHTYASQGVYTATLDVSLPACTTSTDLTINVIHSGIEDEVDINPVRLFPNPAKNQLTVFGVDKAELDNLYLIDNLGRVIKGDDYTVQFNDKTIELNIEDLNSGIYFVIIQEKGAQYSTKFLKL